jgi:hypothetical protein
MRGEPFIKDFIEVIKLDYEIHELTTQHEKETEIRNLEKEARELKEREKKTREEHFEIMLYNDDNLEKL